MCVCSVVSNCLQPHELYSLLGSSVHGVLQARILEWVAIPLSRGSSQPRDCPGSITGGLYSLSLENIQRIYLYINNSYSIIKRQTSPIEKGGKNEIGAS